ncbi:MAG TPA: GxxExxY protein [Gammaproteobacteria bacterium]
MHIEDIGREIVDSALRVHSLMGPGLLEGTYEVCLEHELIKRGLKAVRQIAVPVQYDGILLDAGYRLDLLVEEKVVVELKAIEQLKDIHLAQVLNYLRLGGFQLGYLMNFNVVRMKQGIKRIVNGL